MSIAIDPKTPLTDKQRAIFNWMLEYTKEHFYQPTVREVMDHFGIKSPKGVMAHLRLLQNKGLIRLSKRETNSRAGGGRGRCMEFYRREPISETET